MILSIDHSTTYHFDPPTRGVVQSLRLTPSNCESQRILDWGINIDGAERGAAFRDGAGDWVETAALLGPIDQVTVRVTGQVETSDTGGVLRGHRERTPAEAYLRGTRRTRPDHGLKALARDAVAQINDGDILSRAHALAAGVTEAIAYTPGQTGHSTTAAEALALGHGVCQDHAHALIAAALSLGIPARYVTGYLFASEGEEEHEASHAWAELRVPDLGWVGFDASNGKCPDDHYIRIGSGADAEEASPIRGISQGTGDERLDVRVIVNQVQQ